MPEVIRKILSLEHKDVVRRDFFPLVSKKNIYIREVIRKILNLELEDVVQRDFFLWFQKKYVHTGSN